MIHSLDDKSLSLEEEGEEGGGGGMEKGGEEYYVAYDFEKMQERELGLRKGEKVMVTEKEVEWWFGYRAEEPSLDGWFPANYVEGW